MILKPIAVLYGPILVLYGIFSKKGSWIHILFGVAGMFVAILIGGAIYPKSTPSDLASGRAWDDIGADNEIHGQSINIEMLNIKIRHNNYYQL
jgi:hypothetical protein